MSELHIAPLAFTPTHSAMAAPRPIDEIRGVLGSVVELVVVEVVNIVSVSGEGYESVKVF